MRPTNAPQVILLDLNATLSANMRDVMSVRRKGVPFSKCIAEIEIYREWLVDWMRKTDFLVYLFTVRKIVYREPTLQRIRELSGWNPHRAFFNDTGSSIPERAKEKMLEGHILTHVEPDNLIAFESNQKSRKMFDRHGIRNRRIRVPADIPSVEEIKSGEPIEPVLDHEWPKNRLSI